MSIKKKLKGYLSAGDFDNFVNDCCALGHSSDLDKPLLVHWTHLDTFEHAVGLLPPSPQRDKWAVLLAELKAERVPSEGDTVLVRDKDGQAWKKCIYLFTTRAGLTVTVCPEDVDDYLTNLNFDALTWHQMKPLVTVPITVDGVAHNVDEETVKKIKEMLLTN